MEEAPDKIFTDWLGLQSVSFYGRDPYQYNAFKIGKSQGFTNGVIAGGFIIALIFLFIIMMSMKKAREKEKQIIQQEKRA